MTVLALPSFNTLDFRIDSYNLYSFPNSLLTKYFFMMSIAGESTPLNVSIVTCLTNSSNKMPVLRNLLCLILIKGMYLFINIKEILLFQLFFIQQRSIVFVVLKNQFFLVHFGKNIFIFQESNLSIFECHTTFISICTAIG